MKHEKRAEEPCHTFFEEPQVQEYVGRHNDSLEVTVEHWSVGCDVKRHKEFDYTCCSGGVVRRSWCEKNRDVVFREHNRSAYKGFRRNQTDFVVCQETLKCSGIRTFSGLDCGIFIGVLKNKQERAGLLQRYVLCFGSRNSGSLASFSTESQCVVLLQLRHLCCEEVISAIATF